MTKLLFASILALLLMGFYGVPLQAQNATQGSGMDMKSMKAQMEQMAAQMEQIQTLMKDTKTKMAAADAAMKSHMETEQASMKSQMELQQAIVAYLQTMADHMQTMKKNKGMMDEQKE
jgi:cbb3-type cytochrome oxidase cytochrome c subunit